MHCYLFSPECLPLRLPAPGDGEAAAGRVRHAGHVREQPARPHRETAAQHLPRGRVQPAARVLPLGLPALAVLSEGSQPAHARRAPADHHPRLEDAAQECAHDEELARGDRVDGLRALALRQAGAPALPGLPQGGHARERQLPRGRRLARHALHPAGLQRQRPRGGRRAGALLPVHRRRRGLLPLDHVRTACARLRR